MSSQKIGFWSFVNALGSASYAGLVALFFSNANAIFGPTDTSLSGLAFLLLFVLSATVVSGLVLGRPIYWYLEGKKKEAVKLFGFTVLWLFLTLSIVLGILLLIH